MPRTVTIMLDHDLGKEEARRRIDEGFDKIKSSLSGGALLKFTQNWDAEDSLSFEGKGLGQQVAGKIDVFPNHVRIEATLPSLLASLAEIITGRIESEGKLLLEKK
ncbi:MAG: polyhydroxyalkanoic acid system family protein [Pseudomonadota bacterium]